MNIGGKKRSFSCMCYLHEYRQLYLRNLTSCVQAEQKIRDRDRCTYTSRLIDYTSRLLAYTSRLFSLLVRLITLFSQNYTSRSFFGQNYTSGSQPNSTQWTILRTSVSHNSLKSSPIYTIFIYLSSLYWDLDVHIACEEILWIFLSSSFWQCEAVEHL